MKHEIQLLHIGQHLFSKWNRDANKQTSEMVHKMQCTLQLLLQLWVHIVKMLITASILKTEENK